VFGTVAGVGRETEEALEAGDLALHLDVLLNRDVVGGDQAGDIAAGLDEFVVGAEAEGPIFLKIAGVGDGDADGRGEFEERGAGEGLDDGGDEEPRGDDKPESEKRAGLVEAFGHESGWRNRSVRWSGRG